MTRARPTIPGWYIGPHEEDEAFYLDAETKLWYASTLTLETPPAAYRLTRLIREGDE